MTRDVGNFVHDLVEMAKAMDELPQVQRAFELANQRNDELARTVQDRELAIIDYKAEIEALNARIRTVEAERDDAELRFLEADDRMLKLERTFQKSLEAADEVDKLIQSFKPVPPQPEPVVEVQPKALSPNDLIAAGASSAGYSEPQPDWKQDQAETSTLRPKYPHAGHDYDEPQGQGEVNPTSSNTLQEDTKSAEIGSSNAILEDGLAKASAEPTPGPYTDKLYHDHPVYVHLYDWIAGGGTKESYRWRPDVGSSA